MRDSNRFIRIYNKKQERKDNADAEVMSEHLWREIELKKIWWITGMIALVIYISCNQIGKLSNALRIEQ